MTAQRRSERLIDVPASVAAVSEEAILRTGAKRLSELSDNIPNLIISSTTSLGSQVNIRGVGASSRNIGFDTRVGVYLDGVYLGQSPALNQELVDLERVEVLRGPQGALFGKNTVAGAINLISKKPSNEREAFVGARIGNFDERTFTTRLNLPLGETAAAKLSLNRAERDGFTTNLLDGRTLGDRDAFSWRGQLRFTPNEQLEVLASFDGLRTRERGDYGDPISDTFGVTVDRTAPGRRQVAIDHLSVDRRDILGASVEAAYTLESGTVLKSISAWRDTEFFSTVDVDYSPVNLFWVDFSDAYEQWSQELQWLSPKGERLEYLLGLYLYRQ
ncbi:MAG: TonB-dependent receptor plug domain-containing protein, partial [Caulobacter sp.]